MGGFFGVASKRDCLADVFFGTDYHSHLGTRRGGVAAYDKEIGLQRVIHNIENSPFRTKFDHILEDMQGISAIGCISDSEPQPMLIRSHIGTYAVCYIGAINNADELIESCLGAGHTHFDAMTGGAVNHTELIAALINQKADLIEGLRFAQDSIIGSASILILRDNGAIIAARDKLGRTPILVGKGEDGYSVSFESFAYQKLDYVDYCELGPGEIVEITPEGVTQLVAPGKEMRICAFLWSYYGYSTSTYEGVNVELMRYRNGQIMAENDAKLGNAPNIDYVGGVPDSGTPHAIGYSHKSFLPFARPFIKYTPTWPRSFMSSRQAERAKVAKMKQIPITDLIKDKNLLLVDDSIVRGTQLKETVDFLYDNGAKAVHMRSACPPIMYGCKFLNFSRNKNDMDLLGRRIIMELEGEAGFDHISEYSDPSTERGKEFRKVICEKLGFASLEFQSLQGIIKAIGIDESKLCTYCWS
ncbi:MAG: amidophosphoribosyltransferase, partial [Clostridia bacterium]|nr:amidophosphoribosyltransferase [Clostridia bacterium]